MRRTYGVDLVIVPSDLVLNNGNGCSEVCKHVTTNFIVCFPSRSSCLTGGILVTYDKIRTLFLDLLTHLKVKKKRVNDYCMYTDMALVQDVVFDITLRSSYLKHQQHDSYNVRFVKIIFIFTKQ